MGARTKARKRALDVLFEADARGVGLLATLDARLDQPGTEAPLPEYSAVIVRGVAAQAKAIDAALADASSRPLGRMPDVDRGLARVATWEILFSDDVPAAVAIAEAMALASELSTEDSSAYLNGLLGAVAGLSEQEVDALSGPPGESHGEGEPTAPVE